MWDSKSVFQIFCECDAFILENGSFWQHHIDIGFGEMLQQFNIRCKITLQQLRPKYSVGKIHLVIGMLVILNNNW